MTDDRFERDLRDVLAASAPSDAPDALRRFVATLPTSAAAPRSATRRRAGAATRGAFALVGIAAAIVLAMVLGAGRMGMGPLAGPGTSPASTPAASPTTPTLVYRILPVDGSNASAAELARLAQAVQSRLSGIDVPASVTTDTDRLVVTVPPGTDIDRAAALAGARGHLDFAPVGMEPVEVGEPLDLTAHPPMFTGDRIVSSAVATDEAGEPVADLVLDPAAASTFATYTRENVGASFAIVLDGVTLVAPQIQSEVNDGQLRISGGDEGGHPLGDPRSLVAIIESGELSHPLDLVSVPAASAGAGGASSGAADPARVPVTLAGRVVEPCESTGGCAYFVELVAPDGEVLKLELVDGTGAGVLEPGASGTRDLAPGAHVITATSRSVTDEIGNGARELGPEDARCEATFDVPVDRSDLHVEAVFDRAGCVITVGPL